ncbi:MAG: pilus assembly PilX N-terminal domain-containing protein [Patescibacteria group bacterium]
MSKTSVQSNEEGAVLLYALLVISLITAIAITLSAIVINELRLTANAADATLAYYAAESGIERGLYAVKSYRTQPDKALGDAVTSIQQFVDTNFTNNAQYSCAGTSASIVKVENRLIRQNQSVSVDLYSASDPLGADTSTSIVRSVRVQNSGTDPLSYADVSWTAWDTDGNIGTSTSARRIIEPSNLLGDGWPINIDTGFAFPSLGTPVGYRLRVKALYGDLSGVTVTPYTTPDADPLTGTLPTNLPSVLQISAVGQRGQFKQALTASLPWRLPLGGLYDYVIFSESDILKNIILSQPVFSSGTIQAEANVTATCYCSGAIPPLCSTSGWLAAQCSSSSVTCTQNSHCTLPGGGSGESFTLPIPITVPAGQAYYISVRTKGSGAATGQVDVNVTDPEQGDLGFTMTFPAAATGWSSCTIGESFALGTTTAGRTVKFTNRAGVGNAVDIDWYQISSYKVFPDCP